MNKDQVQGRVEEAKGSVKQTTGRVTGKPDLEDRGTLEKAAGKMQKTFGDVKEQFKDANKRP
ncbi:MAG: CsbD family protein [Steroidobacteraceae bacterium]